MIDFRLFCFFFGKKNALLPELLNFNYLKPRPVIRSLGSPVTLLLDHRDEDEQKKILFFFY